MQCVDLGGRRIIKKNAMEILNSIKPPNLKFHEISKDVNNPVNNDPALIKPLN